MPFYGFDVQTGYYCRSSRTLSCERRAPFDQDSTPHYHTRQAASAFQSCLCFSATLGAWCVQSASVCCSWAILNVKYYWLPFWKMESYFLLINHKNQFLGVTFVSVLGLDVAACLMKSHHRYSFYPSVPTCASHMLLFTYKFVRTARLRIHFDLASSLDRKSWCLAMWRY